MLIKRSQLYSSSSSLSPSIEKCTIKAGDLGMSHNGILLIPALSSLKKKDVFILEQAMRKQSLVIGKDLAIPWRASVIAVHESESDSQYHSICTHNEVLSHFDYGIISSFDLIMPFFEMPTANSVDDTLLATPATSSLNVHLFDVQQPPPRIGDAAGKLLSNFYVAVRNQHSAALNGEPTLLNAISLQSMKRLACAHAVLHSRNMVRIIDALVSITLTDETLKIKFGRTVLPKSVNTLKNWIQLVDYYDDVVLFLKEVATNHPHG
jgi:DNA replicative helicase MCM subunit Mcm2 (Cdc46/Mcm family)